MRHLLHGKYYHQAVILWALGLGLLGCGGGDDEDEDASSASPVIAGLQFTPDATTIGQPTPVGGFFIYLDEDADVTTLSIGMREPGADTEQVTSTPLPDAMGELEGSVTFAFQLDPALTGIHALEFWLTDEEGNESNRLEGEIDVR
ncbi:hypothetical protein [Sorangium sp. So ce1099]|uniref:hypothetical protein n=1 Tax=Sorangium sp. So ce1099 TaxID=3133331 RepID=UPI003F627C3C